MNWVVFTKKLPAWVTLVLIAVAVGLSVFFMHQFKDYVSQGLLGDLFHIKLPVAESTSGKVPQHVVDHWYERVVYRDTPPDTVEIVRYEETPVTLDFVQAEIQGDGRVRIEVLVNSHESRVLQGQLAASGSTHIVVNPDSTLSFVTSRFGYDASITGGVSSAGGMLSLETLYANDVPLIHTTLHGPNPSIGYATSNNGWVGLGVSAEVAPFHTPLRLGGGARTDIDDLTDFSFDKVGWFGALTVELWDF